ncbi:Cof-type HAD-IIB family hydrolase [Thalassobacillus sp. C254]|uniref:Cof-type HAD-IIB family hydrolase n=1 Tax=Thalassobacillus sp. C254 TaxID=1225341 RepID=UPI0006CFA4A3|nr:Cof-type HAD-IIB family hydrolase [Thalassobacillus sp. C254]
MNIKLIITDIDGTLLRNDHSLTKRTVKVFGEWRRQGAKVMLATGRHPVSCRSLAKQLNLEDPVISLNGGCVFDPRSDEIFYQEGLEMEDLHPFIEWARPLKQAYHLNTIKGCFTDTEKIGHFEHLQQIKDVTTIKDPVMKMAITGAEEKLNSIFDEVCSIETTHRIVRSGEDTIDVMPSHVNKGAAMRTICERLGIHPNEVIAFGNYFNDREMIREAGIGVVMNNAPSALKAEADIIALSNEEEGVADILEAMLGEKPFKNTAAEA